LVCDVVNVSRDGELVKMHSLTGELRHVAMSTVMVLLLIGAARAQDLEPRAYSPSPVGTTFAGFSFGRSSGDISFDPTVPITNAQATLYSTSGDGAEAGKIPPNRGRNV
jgi:hypothetical protein